MLDVAIIGCGVVGAAAAYELSDASSDADSDETGFDSTGEADSDTDSATEAVLVSAFAPQPDARSITPQRITPIIL